MHTRYTFLSLAIASAFLAALFAFVPDASSHERSKSGHFLFGQFEQPYVAPTVRELPAVKNFTGARPSRCWERLALLLAALDSKECS